MKFWRLAFMACVCLPLARAAGDDTAQFTQPPPAIYKQSLAKLLTPLGDVLKKEADYSHWQGDGVILLDEVVHYVDESGKRISVYHEVEKALNEAGARAMAKYNFTYKKKTQRVFLVAAQTIQPDGTKDPIKNDAIFLKTPQDQEGDAIYNDEVTLLTVYSNVKVGSITEHIIVLEDLEPRIPGQYTQVYTWSAWWPNYWQRLVVDLPKSFADRLKVTNLGLSVPSPTKTNPSPERQRLTWELLNTPADKDDNSNAPYLQTGPLVWLTTLPDWDAFASWYNSLTQGTDNLSPELKRKIDGWTKDAKTPADILRILYEHVAQDVRYTGFELGKADLQPHDSMSVWERQYGDCKDKANLLRVMLAYKGIPSWLALLSSEHAGLVDKAAPDYRQFDHCILDVQIGDTTTICDPTITYGEPGMLSGSDSDRDLLVIKDNQAEWIHSPPFQNASFGFALDLQLRPSGELAGWVEKSATGYYAASELKYYLNLTKDDLLDRLQSEVRDILPNCTLADVTPVMQPPPPGERATTGVATFAIKAYVVLPGVLNQGADTAQLKFPATSMFLPSLDNYQSRQHLSFFWPDIERVTMSIHLPPGWQAPNLPAPMTYDSAQSNLKAAWTAEQNTLTAGLAVTLKQALFRPDELQTFGNAVTNLQSWASQSLLLAKSNEAPATPTPPQTDQDLAANLPTMPTGEGQINLIDSEFPEEGNRAARRAALERIPTLFPADKKAIVDAVLDLAMMDLDDEKWDAAIARIKSAVDANRSALSAETISWADYITARALTGQKKNDDALAIFRRIAQDPALSSFRRVWASYRAVQILADTAPASALDLGDQALNLASSAIPLLYQTYATTAIKSNQASRLKDRLTKLIAAKPENLEDILLAVVEAAQDLIDTGNQQDGIALVGLLESLGNATTTGDAFARAVKKAHNSADSAAAYVKLQQELRQILAQFPDVAKLEQAQPPFASRNDAEKSMAQHVDNNEPDQALGCALRLMAGYAADKSFPQYCWDSVNYSDWALRRDATSPLEPFLLRLIALGAELPHEVDAFVDIKLIQARVLERKGQRAEAAAIYDSLKQDKTIPEGFAGPLALRSGTNWEQLGDYLKALASYQFAEPVVDSESDAQQAVLRAAFIRLDDGNNTEALRLLRLLTQAVQKGKIQIAEQVEEFADIADGVADIPDYWDNWKAWWAQWQRIEGYAGLDPVKDQKIIPIFTSWVDLEGNLLAAKNNKDNKQFFALLRQMAYAARDYPNAAEEFVGMLPTAEELLPEHANDFRLLAIALLEPLAPKHPVEQRRRILNLIINYVDSAQPAKALDLIAHDWKPALENGANVAQAIHRVWAIAALAEHRDLATVADLMAKDLELPDVTYRGRTIMALANVDVALGRQTDALKLLEAAQTDPKLKADPDLQKELASDLENIRNVAEISQQLTKGVALWLKDNQPPWWDYAEPKSASDPRMARLNEILGNSTGELQPDELIKAGLLAPGVTTLSATDQQDAVRQSFEAMLDQISDQSQADAFAKTILDNPELPMALKHDILYHVLCQTGTLRQTSSYDYFKQLPLYDGCASYQKDVVNRIGDYMKVDRTSTAQLTAYVKKLAQHPMESLDLGITQDTVAYLLELGDLDDATAIYQAAADYTFAPNDHMTKPEFQLTLLKDINSAKRLKPIFDALQQVLFAHYPPDTILRPDNFDQRRKRGYFDDLSEAEANRYRLYLIKTHQAPLNLQLWFELMADLPHDAASANLNLDLVKAGLENAPTDELKAAFVASVPGLFDFDNPDLRQKLLGILQPYRNPVKYPQTMENIRIFDVIITLRTGSPINLETDLGGFTSRANAFRATRYKIRAYLQRQDLAHLKATLNSLPADQMMSPSLVREVLPALEAVGLNDEAELARDILRKSLYRQVLATWVYPTAYNLDAVTADMAALNSAQDIPAAFSRFVSARVVRQQSLLNFDLFQAYLNKDWAAAAGFGAAFTQAFPNFYTQYWYWGRSLAELGKKQDAIKALTVYCQYSLDEPTYPEAKALLDKLTTGK